LRIIESDKEWKMMELYSNPDDETDWSAGKKRIKVEVEVEKREEDGDWWECNRLQR
jgi:hypothetical protein